MSKVTQELDQAGFNKLHDKMQRLHNVARHDCIRELKDLIELAPGLLESLENNLHGKSPTVEHMHSIINRLRDSYTQLSMYENHIKSLDWLHDVIDDRTSDEEE